MGKFASDRVLLDASYQVTSKYAVKSKGCQWYGSVILGSVTAEDVSIHSGAGYEMSERND